MAARRTLSFFSILFFVSISLFGLTRLGFAAPRRPVSLLEATNSISGTIYQADGQIPIGGAEIEVTDWETNDFIDTTWSNSDGSYNLSGLADGSYRLRAQSDGYAWEYYPDAVVYSQATSVTVAGGQTSAGMDFALQPAGTTSGVVQDAAGVDPLEGIYVELIVWEGIRSVFVTGQDGAFSFQEVPYNVPFYLIAWSGPEGGDYIMEFWQEAVDWDGASTVTLSADNPVISTITFTLEKVGAITGTVMAEQGGGVLAGATVCIKNTNGGWWDNCVDTTTDGQYNLGGLSPGSYYVRAQKTGFATEYYDDAFKLDQAITVTVSDGQVTPGIDFVLAPGGTISGVVLDAAGQNPLEGMYIELLQYSGGIWMVDFSKADGSFRFEGVPYGIEFNLLAWSGPEGGDYFMEFWEEALGWDDASTVTLTAENPAVSTITFTLAKGAAITGTITAEEGGGALEGATVCVRDANSSGWWDNCVPTGEDGSYSIGGLWPSQYWVRAEGDGYAFEFYDGVLNMVDAISLTLTDGQVLPGIDFALASGGTISGVVKDAWDNPLAGMTVELLLKDKGIRAVSGTDGDGNFHFDGVPYDIGYYLLAWDGIGGDYFMEFWEEALGWDDAATVTLTAENPAVSGINFSLDKPAIITGTVTYSDGTTPVVGACLYASTTVPELNAVGQGVYQDGVFTLTDLRPGPVYLRTAANCSGAHPNLQDEWYVPGGSTPDASLAQAITLTSGHVITGLVLSLEPAPAAQISPESGGTVTSTADLTTTVAFPPGAVSEPVTVTFRLTTTLPTAGDFQFVGQRFAIQAVTAAGIPVTSFSQPFTLTIHYRDEDVGGLYEGSLGLYYWNLERTAWEQVPASFDPQTNTLVATIDHLTDFAILGDHFKIYLPVMQR